MEGCDIKAICQIPRLSKREITKLLKEESGKLEITKSLLNLLYNIVEVESVPVTKIQIDIFKKYWGTVDELLSTGKSYKWKKAKLASNLNLVINIAASCPTVAGS